jgi:DHA2 family multidrug resistance protein-like MFS transporter
VLLRYFRWNAVFLLAVPVMLLLLIVGPILLPESRGSSTKPLDVRGAALSLGAILFFIYGLKRSAHDGFVPSSALSVVVGIVLGAMFVRQQRALTDPLVDLRLLRTRTFSVPLAMYMLVTVLTFGSYLLVAQHLQLVLGLSPLAAGVWMLPWSASYVVGSFVGPVLARRFQPAFVMAGGLMLAAAGFVVVTRVAGLGVGPVIAVSTLYSLGMSPVFTLGVAAIVAAAPAERAGAAAGLAETGSELGGALGIAVIGSIATATYRASLHQAGLADIPPEAHAAALDTLGAAVAAAARLPDPTGAVLLGAAKLAFMHAVQIALGICAALSLLLSIVAALALQRPRAARKHRRPTPGPLVVAARVESQSPAPP